MSARRNLYVILKLICTDIDTKDLSFFIQVFVDLFGYQESLKSWTIRWILVSLPQSLQSPYQDIT